MLNGNANNQEATTYEEKSLVFSCNFSTNLYLFFYLYRAFQQKIKSQQKFISIFFLGKMWRNEKQKMEAKSLIQFPWQKWRNERKDSFYRIYIIHILSEWLLISTYFYIFTRTTNNILRNSVFFVLGCVVFVKLSFLVAVIVHDTHTQQCKYYEEITMLIISL